METEKRKTSRFPHKCRLRSLKGIAFPLVKQKNVASSLEAQQAFSGARRVGRCADYTKTAKTQVFFRWPLCPRAGPAGR